MTKEEAVSKPEQPIDDETLDLLKKIVEAESTWTKPQPIGREDK